MKISNNDSKNQIFFMQKPPSDALKNAAKQTLEYINNEKIVNGFFADAKIQDKLGRGEHEDVLKALDDRKVLESAYKPNTLQNVAISDPPKYLSFLAKFVRRLVPFIDKRMVKDKGSIDNMVNVGNVAKEFVCMIVYPLQVLTNPDIPKEKRRFVGMYDFFVTCFSLAGALWAMRFGKSQMKIIASKLMKTYQQNPSLYAKKKVDRAIDGGAFVLNIAIMTILFKRIFAPALSPPLAAKTRIMMENRDKAKEKEKSKIATASKPAKNN